MENNIYIYYCTASMDEDLDLWNKSFAIVWRVCGIVHKTSHHANIYKVIIVKHNQTAMIYHNWFSLEGLNIFSQIAICLKCTKKQVQSKRNLQYTEFIQIIQLRLSSKVKAQKRRTSTWKRLLGYFYSLFTGTDNF